MSARYLGCKPSDVSFRPSDGLIVQTDYDQSGNVIAWSELTIAAAKDRVSRFQTAIRAAELTQADSVLINAVE